MWFLSLVLLICCNTFIFAFLKWDQVDHDFCCFWCLVEFVLQVHYWKILCLCSLKIFANNSLSFLLCPCSVQFWFHRMSFIIFFPFLCHGVLVSFLFKLLIEFHSEFIGSCVVFFGETLYYCFNLTAYYWCI
jgi:hypothetical protein